MLNSGHAQVKVVLRQFNIYLFICIFFVKLIFLCSISAITASERKLDWIVVSCLDKSGKVLASFYGTTDNWFQKAITEKYTPQTCSKVDKVPAFATKA